MNSLPQIAARERLEMSRMANVAGYWPVKGRRVKKVFRVLPVYYDGPALGEPRRANIPRRALIEALAEVDR